MVNKYLAFKLKVPVLSAKLLILYYDIIIYFLGMDGDRGAAVAGGRGYYLKGAAVFLEQALIQLSLRILHKKNYTPLYTPFFMRKDVSEC